MPKKVAIVGSRGFPDLQKVRDFVLSLPKDTIIVSGTEPPPNDVKRNRRDGVDETAIREARLHGYETVVFPASWDKFGKSAGMMRNSTIATVATEVYAFWDGNSPGTLDIIKKSDKLGKLKKIFYP